MAEDFLEEIYRDAGQICKLKQAVEYVKVHDDYHAVLMCNELLPGLCDVCKQYLKQNNAKGIELWNGIQELTKVYGDLILLGDIIEGRIIPLLEERMQQYGGIQTENDEGDFCFESTVSGFLTLKDLKRNLYIHSTIDPMWEAGKQAEYIFEPHKLEYCIRGCGLGYLIYQLYEISNGAAVINVFERDERIVQYARKYGVLDWIPNDNLNIIIDDDPYSFLEKAKREDMGSYILAPELYGEPEAARDVLQEAYMEFSNRKEFARDIEINYWKNLKSGCKMVSEFDTSKFGKDFIVVAAGPSLDDNMEFLRENKGKKVLIAVGTVLKKLLQNSIIPDLAVFLDHQLVIYRQIEGITNQDIPILVAMPACWKCVAAYQGEKYLVPLSDVCDPNMKFDDAWQVGGTVTHMGIEAAVRFGAENIYLAGVDLAYPGGVSHAMGTLQRAEKSIEGLIPVEGVGNETVYTDRVFISYRRWIEEKIVDTPWISYYNMSRIGAKIAGTKINTAVYEKREQRDYAGRNEF